MKITYTCYLHPYTAMGVIAINVVKELTKLGYDVGLNAINPPNDPNKVNPQDYPIEVQEALRKGHRFDSINIFFAYPDVYPHVRCKVNVGYTGADSTGWYTTQGSTPPWISCNEYMDFMLTPADYSRCIMKGCGVIKPIHLFPHGIDTSLFPYQSRKDTTPFTFVYCGEMSKRKGTQDLIKVFKGLFQNSEKYRLILRSNTDMLYYNGSEIESLTKGVPNIEVHFKNFGQKELSEYYKRGHVYVYPSRADWFGMTPFESLATGMPTIATATNGYFEFLHNDIIAVNYEDKPIGNEHPYLLGDWHQVNTEQLKEAMYISVMNYGNELKKARIASLKIHEKFTWERVTQDYLVPFLKGIGKVNTTIQVPDNYVLKQERESMVKEFNISQPIILNESKESRMDNPRISVGVPTKDRGIELAMLLQSLTAQTYQNFDVLINDDGLSGIINNNSTIQGLINLLKQQGHDVTIMKGETKGPHFGGQAILDNSNNELILRIDDDIALEPEALEELIKPFINPETCDTIAAVGMSILNPHEDLSKQQMDLDSFNRQYKEGLGRVFWINENQLFLSGMLSINKLPVDYPVEVEHLYSSFMYRKSVGKQIGGYNLQLSKVGHREETIFTYSMFKAGYKLYVAPKAIGYHYHPMQGGIRETMGDIHKEELWKHDEEIFSKWIREVLPPPQPVNPNPPENDKIDKSYESYESSIKDEDVTHTELKPYTKELIDRVQKLYNDYLQNNKESDREVLDITFKTTKGNEDIIDTSDIPELSEDQIKNGQRWKDMQEELLMRSENKPNSKSDLITVPPIVSVVILTCGIEHKGLKVLLNGIIKYTKTPYEVIIVNNDSRIESREDIEKLINIELREIIRMGTRLKAVTVPSEMAVGAARGWGAKFASEYSEYILFIDDDAQIVGFPERSFGTDWIDMMLSIFNESKDVAAVSPILTWYHPLKCYAVSVACMLTSKKVWGIIGGFDPVFGNKEKQTWGYEDVDWSYRAQCHGFKLKWIGNYNMPFIHEDTTIKPKTEERERALIKAQSILHSKYDLNEIDYFSRTGYPFTKEQMEASVNGINLNIGCYYTHFDNFINIDIKNDCGADLICDMREIDNHFKDNTVSVILASQVLEHVILSDAEIFLSKCYRMLRPGGHLIVEVPDCENMDERVKNGEMHEEDRRCHIEGMPNEYGQAHLHCYVESELRAMISRAGLKVIQRNSESSDKDAYAIRLDCIKL